MQDNYLIIMAGGIGSRFWPFSRKNFPKQFQDILGMGSSLLQQTVRRFEGICPKENIYIVTHKDYAYLVKEQLPFMKDEQILLEPMMRNTAPCIAYASYKIAQKNPKANLVVSPADHLILQEDDFRKDIFAALELTSKNNVLATLGIKPTRPDTGYGYIQVLQDVQMGGLQKVKTFTEKPKLEQAKLFLESGDFVWNSGIFVWNVQTIMKAFETLLPEVAEPIKEISHFFYTQAEELAIKNAYFQCKNISIDYGIMEKSEEVYVRLSHFSWSDLGTWKSLYEQAKKDKNENVVLGTAITYETKNTIIKTPKDRLIVVQGLENYIIAEYDNVLLICQKDQEQRIKEFVSDVKERKDGDNYM
jgi:mannose-1-phosphate guanylyltransferase